MSRTNTLAGLHRWVTLPSTAGALVGVVLAVMYAAFTVDITPGTEWLFAGVIVAWVLLAVGFGVRAEQSRLSTLAELGKAASPPTVAALQRAVREAARIPDVTFRTNLSLWVFTSAAIGFSYALVPDVPWQSGARVAFIGLLVGPLLSMLVLLMVQRRARVVIEKIAATGLSPQQVVAALPKGRTQLALRFSLFTAVAVATPMMMVADLARLRAIGIVNALDAGVVSPAELLYATRLGGLVQLVVVGGLVLAIVVLCASLAGGSFGSPLKVIADETQRVARGRLGKPKLVPADDEVWAATAALISMELQLVEALSKLRVAGSKIGTTTQELVASSHKHEAGAHEQTGALAQTSATTEELARSARQIADNASDVSALAQAMLDAANGGKQSAGAFYNSILRVRDGNQVVADSVVKLNKRVQQVGRIVEFIDGIADKSDLLALNAELEGTKAGEIGRGFSLVAAEMRRLSESVMSSTREINRLIDEIRDATNAAVMATEAGVKATDSGSALARRVTDSLDHIVEFANRTSDAVKSITLATHQQQNGTDQLAQAMTAILSSTQSGALATKQMSSANADLSALSGELQTTVSRFEVES